MKDNDLRLYSKQISDLLLKNLRESIEATQTKLHNEKLAVQVGEKIEFPDYNKWSTHGSHYYDTWDSIQNAGTRSIDDCGTLHYQYTFDPVSGPQPASKAETTMPDGLPWWSQADLQNRDDLWTLMLGDSDFSYAQCTWLELQEGYGYAFPGGWDKWYRYGISHCPRYAKEQPRWRKDAS